MMRVIDVGDFIDAWQDFMSTATHSLKIKYGLGVEPREAQLKRWLYLTNQYVREGQARKNAGHAVAKYIFPDYRTRFSALEAAAVAIRFLGDELDPGWILLGCTAANKNNQPRLSSIRASTTF